MREYRTGENTGTSNDTRNNYTGRADAIAVQLLELLIEVYSGYLEKSKKQDSTTKGIARLFKRWFTGYNPLIIEPINQGFIEDVGNIVTQFAASLNDLKQSDPALCNVYAAKAANLMLAPKPAREKTTAEWYMTIAEYQSAAILPYLAWDDLKQIKDDQLKCMSKRMMYPKQRELHELIEKLIKDKQSE